MRYFKKLVSLPIVILPERGRVYDTDLLGGDEYAKYVPLYLYETDARGWPIQKSGQGASPTPVNHVQPTQPPVPDRMVRPTDGPTQAVAEPERPSVVSALEAELERARRETVPLEEPTPQQPTPQQPQQDTSSTTLASRDTLQDEAKEPQGKKKKRKYVVSFPDDV